MQWRALTCAAQGALHSLEHDLLGLIPRRLQHEVHAALLRVLPLWASQESGYLMLLDGRHADWLKCNHRREVCTAVGMQRTCIVMMGLGRMCSAGGRQAVPLPRPLRWLMRSWKSRLSWLNRCRVRGNGAWDQAAGGKQSCARVCA